MNAPIKTKWLCRQCYKYLSSKRSYDEHMNIHNESRPFGCDQCSYAAASQMTLRRHKLRNHIPRQDWGYQCPYCVEAYMEPASYQQHVLTRHFGKSATFGCPHGGCAFTSKSSKHFREHVSKHIVVVSSKRTSQIRQHVSLRADFNIAAHLVDDELGSGYGKDALKPVARRVSNILSLAKHPSSGLQSKNSPSICTRKTKSFLILDREFLKTPINLDSLGAAKPESQSHKNEEFLRPTDTDAQFHRSSWSRQLCREEEMECYVENNDKHFAEKLARYQCPATAADEANVVDWIETEIVIDSVVDQPNLLPDGQIDIELD